MAIDQIEASLKASENFLTALDQYIKSQILASWPDRVPGIDGIAHALDDLVSKSASALEAAETEIKTQIDPLIRNAIPNALDFVGSLTRSLDSHLTQLIGNIATTEDVLGTAISEIRQWSPHLANWVQQYVAGAFGNVALGVLETLERESPDLVDPILDELLTLKVLPKHIHDTIQHVRNRQHPIVAFLLIPIILGSLLPILGALGEPVVESVKQGAWSNIRTKEVDYPALITLAMRSNISDTEFHTRMSHYGFNDDVARYMKSAATELLPVETVTRAYLRGEITKPTWEAQLSARGIDSGRAELVRAAALSLNTEQDAREAFLRGFVDVAGHDRMLGRLGFEADAAKLRRELYFYIPPPQDLIHMAIRNVFTPEIVDRFQLFSDFPEPFKQAAAQQGISELWAERYWGAHWIVPGNEEAFAMFQRTVDHSDDPNADEITLSDGSKVQNIIGGSTLRLLLREKDIAPFYRHKLTQLAYHPLTRIDVRRLAALGLLNHAEVERAYLDLGYSQKNALRLADFVDALNKKTKKDEAATLVDGLRKETLRLYVAGKVTDEELDQTLSELSFTKAEVEVFKAEAMLVARSERLQRIETRIGKLYVAGMIDAQEAEKRLRDHDTPDAAITQLFVEWDLDIEYRGGTEHIHKHRELTKNEILDALRDGFIDEPTAQTMLIDSGYDATEVPALTALSLFQAAKATKKTQIEAVKAMYVSGLVTDLDTSNKLDSLRVPSDQRNAYMAEWSLQRETRTERIPIATLRDMFKGNYFTRDQTFAHLKRHRFTDDDANDLLNFWSAQPAPKRLVNA